MKGVRYTKNGVTTVLNRNEFKAMLAAHLKERQKRKKMAETYLGRERLKKQGLKY